MAETKARKLSSKEMAWYIIAAILGFIGLVFIVFAIVGDFLPVLASENWVYVSEAAWLTNWTPLGYRYWGLILVGVGVLIAVAALNFFAREGDKDEERALRRAQRLAFQNEPIDNEADKPAE
ncbi:MAG: hypothetical protein II467_03835 [Bacilli bacterium]|jgi:hypothetical protein|nr:hypothetical protein [Bacilli bacterium]MBQ4254747.1 hypothetical protein [Bacilli bacterium]